jgi:hypothetical protein
MIDVLIYIVAAAIVLGLVYWLLDFVPVPEPFNKIAKVALVVIFVIIIVSMLLGIIGHAPSVKLP